MKKANNRRSVPAKVMAMNKLENLLDEIIEREGYQEMADGAEQMLDAARPIIENLRDALRDMVAIARRDGWRDVTTGRQIVLRAAEAALDAAKVTE